MPEYPEPEEQKVPEDSELNTDQEDLAEKPDPEKTKQTEKELAEKVNENKHYHFFVVHESTGKVEVLDAVQPGVISYAFDPNRVTPRDLKYILEATYDSAKIESRTDVKILQLPLAGLKRTTVVLDIRNRSNIELGTMELWRYGK